MVGCEPEHGAIGAQCRLIIAQPPECLGQAQVTDRPVGELSGDEGEYFARFLALRRLPELLRATDEDERIDFGPLWRLGHDGSIRFDRPLRSLVEQQVDELIRYGEAAPQLDRAPPASGIAVEISELFWQQSDPRDRRPWITPDLPATPTMRDRLDGRDAVLEAALAHEPSATPGESFGPPLSRWQRAGQLVEESWPELLEPAARPVATEARPVTEPRPTEPCAS